MKLIKKQQRNTLLLNLMPFLDVKKLNQESGIQAMWEDEQLVNPKTQDNLKILDNGLMT